MLKENAMPQNINYKPRRLLVKGMLGAAMAGLISAPPSTASKTKEKWIMVIDLNRCLGCQSCTMACKAESSTPAGLFRTQVLVDDKDASGRISFLPVQCNHCDDPACVQACSSGAVKKLAEGLLVTDWNICRGDGACVSACTYSARILNKIDGNKADSCDFCVGRLADGRVPACVEACSSGARVFGDSLAPSAELAAYLSGLRGQAKARRGLPAGRVLYVPLRKGEADA